MTARKVDILIDGGSVVTVDGDRRIIRDGAVAIANGQIVAVGKAADLRGQVSATRTYDGRNKCIIPGFVNAHIHLYHTLHKNLPPESLCGLPWAREVHGRLAVAMSAEDETASALLTLLDCLRSGVTTFLDAGCHHVEAAFEHLPVLGMRGLLGKRLLDQESHGHAASVQSTDGCLADAEAVMRLGSPDGLLGPCVTLVGNGRCSDALIRGGKALADAAGTILNMHHAAHIENMNASQMANGVGPTEHLADLGVLGRNVALVHMLHVLPGEIRFLAETGTSVIHCPSSAMKLAYGLSKFGRIPEMVQAGVNVAIGTDPFDCGNDMLRTMALTALVHKDLRFDPGINSAEQILEQATINGARAMGMDHLIGSIEVGKRADIAIFDMNRADWLPVHSEVRNLVYAAAGDSCESVIVDGRFILDRGEVTTLDEAQLLDRVQESAVALRRRAGVAPAGPWRAE